MGTALETKTPTIGGYAKKEINEDGEIDAVSVKLPSFWTENPEAWFLRAESQFNTKGIKQDETKYDHIIQSLDWAQTKEILHIMKKPPNSGKYELVRAALIKAFAKSQLEKDTELLNCLHLGDQKPSAFARKMRMLNEDPETLLKAIMLKVLPADVRTALANKEGLNTIEEIGAVADNIMEYRKEKWGVNEIGASPQEEEIDAVQRRNAGRPYQDKGHGRQASAPGGRGRGGEASFQCFAHKKFGPNAYSCKPGCMFANLPLATKTTGAGNGPAGR